MDSCSALTRQGLLPSGSITHPQWTRFDHLRQNLQLEMCKSPWGLFELSAGREEKVNRITERILLPGSVLWGLLEMLDFPVSAE